MAEAQRLRCERFKLGIYAVIGLSVLCLSGMLIQGCKREQAPKVAALGPIAATPEPMDLANAPVTNGEPEAMTNLPESPFPTEATTPAAVDKPATPVASENSAGQPASQAPVPKASTSRSPSTKVYIVKRGDTLTRIAILHHTTVSALRRANSLKSDRILAGSKLKIPQPRTAAAASAAVRS